MKSPLQTQFLRFQRNGAILLRCPILRHVLHAHCQFDSLLPCTVGGQLPVDERPLVSAGALVVGTDGGETVRR